MTIMMYNILILSAGRRVELVNQFKKAAIDLKLKSHVITADCSELAPALYFGDKKYIIPKVNDINYIGELIKIIKQNDIKLVVPTIDTELLLLAQNKDYIESETYTKIMISNVQLIKICRDKFQTSDYLTGLGLDVPKIYNINDLSQDDSRFPVFIKPKSGSSSINAYKVECYNDLLLYSNLIGDYIIQEFVCGNEYTIDAFLDFDSNPISIVPRLRIATRSGEISKGKIIKDFEIINVIKDLLYKTNFIGHITIQLIKSEKGIKIIEINPRFGGGAPMSISAGANSCVFLYKLLIGETLSYTEEYTDNLIFLRYDSSIKLQDKDLL